MRTALLVLVLGLVGCGTSATEPEPKPEPVECEPLPWCHAFDNDVVIEPLTPLPPDTLPADSLAH